MEAFSLLKYWRSTTRGLTKSTQTTTTTTTPVIATASPRSSTSSSDNDHGPYFDLEFALGDEKEETPLNPNDIHVLTQENETEGEEEEEEEEELEVSLRISPSSSSNCSSKEHSHSKIDENVDYLVPIETSSLIVTSSDSTQKFSNNLLKSASKFRVLMALKLKKLKENAVEEGKKEGEKGETENSNNQTEKETQKRKFFTVKFIKVDEVPIVSLFTRDHSSKSENRKGLPSSPLHKNLGSSEKNVKPNEDNKDEEEKRLTKDVMQKYLKMVKPLYVRASKRYSGTGEVKGGGDVEAVVESVKNSVKERNFTAGLKVVLGKSKSASAVPVEAPPLSKRRDDSLIQQQDGIQSAIMHCKRSFNASRESQAKVVATSSTKGQKV